MGICLSIRPRHCLVRRSKTGKKTDGNYKKCIRGACLHCSSYYCHVVIGTVRNNRRVFRCRPSSDCNSYYYFFITRIYGRHNGMHFLAFQFSRSLVPCGLCESFMAYSAMALPPLVVHNEAFIWISETLPRPTFGPFVYRFLHGHQPALCKLNVSIKFSAN